MALSVIERGIAGTVRARPVGGGGFQAVLGLIFMGVGGLLWAVFRDGTAVEAEELRGLAVWGAWAALGAAVLGAVGVVHAVLRLVQRLLDRRPEWKRDYAWPEDGRIQDDGGIRTAAVVINLSLFGFMLAFLMALENRFAGGGAMLLSGLAPLALAAGLGWFLYGDRLRSRLRYGRATLTLADMPLRPGGSITADFEAKAELAHPVFTLRCVAERYEGSGRHGRYYRDLVAVGEARVGMATTGGRRLTLSVPEDAPQNRLREAAPLYWELQVIERDMGFEASFLIPVYQA